MKLKKLLMGYFHLLRKLFGDNYVSCKQFERHKRFLECWEKFEDNDYSDQPVTSRIDKNIKKINEIWRKH